MKFKLLTIIFLTHVFVVYSTDSSGQNQPIKRLKKDSVVSDNKITDDPFVSNVMGDNEVEAQLMIVLNFNLPRH